VLYRILSVFDGVSGSYSQPFYTPAVGAGVRSFSDEVNRAGTDNVYFNHPSDFSLMLLGTFDPVSGVITPCQQPELIARAADLRSQ